MTPDDKKLLEETSYRLLLVTIPRWTRIDMRRRQNVAEHSFNVLVLSLSLYDFMQQVPHNSFDRDSIVTWAIDHDMDEIETGDMPAPLKIALNKSLPGAVETTVDDIMVTKLPSYIARKRGIKDSYPYHVVKIADKLEEVLYNKAHGHDLRAELALVDGLRLLRERLLAAEAAHPRYDWYRARLWLEHFLKTVLEAQPRPYYPSNMDILDPAPPTAT